MRSCEGAGKLAWWGVRRRAAIWAWLGALAMLAICQASWAESTDEGQSTRPIVTVVLTDSQELSGVLQSFVGGIYTVSMDGVWRSFPEWQIESITFQMPPAGEVQADPSAEPTVIAPQAQPAKAGPTIAEQIEQLNVAAGRFHRSHERIDPALISQLAAMGADAVTPLLAEQGKNDNTVYYAGKVFAEMDLSVLPVVLAAYAKDHSRMSLRAVESVLSQCDHESHPLVLSLMENTDAPVRLVAVRALIRIVPQGTTEDDALGAVIASILADPSSEVRAEVPRLMARAYAGQSVLLTKLIELRKTHSDENVRHAAVGQLRSMALNKRAGNQALKPIMAAIADAIENDSSEKVRAMAAFAIGEFGDRGVSAWPALLASAEKYGTSHAINEALQRTGLAAGIALREAGVEDEELILLISQLASNSRQLETAAKAELIRRGKGNLAVMILAARLDSQNRYWHDIGDVIGAWGPDVLPALDAYVADKDDIVRRTVAWACGEMKVDQVPDPLAALLADSDELVRTYALEALVTLSERPNKELRQQVVPLLFAGLKGGSIHRSHWPHAIDALAKIGVNHPGIVDGLLEIMKESSDASYRRHAASELGRLARRLREDHVEAKRIISELIVVVREDTDEVVRISAIAFLGYLGERATAALPALREAEGDSYEAVVKAAKDAIARIGESPDQ